MTTNEAHFSIAAVERETGLSKDVLRVWERRYGFPVPIRGANAERLYPLIQVERLRLIKKLMDQGHRPGKLIEKSLDELNSLPLGKPQDVGPDDASTAVELEELLSLITRHEVGGYLQALQHQLARRGLAGFVQDIIGPLSSRVGLAWERGTLKVFEEHLFTELTKRVLRQAIANLPLNAQQRPCVMLTTVPGEQHALGLLMAEAMFALEGAKCVPLGTEMPLTEIAQAARAHQADIVALSFSSAFPQRQIGELLKQLRALLPASVQLWIGGSGAQSSTAVTFEGIRVLDSFATSQRALSEWTAHFSAASSALNEK